MNNKNNSNRSQKLNDKFNPSPSSSDTGDENQPNDTSRSSEPFFVMTLEFEKGKYKKIKIFPSSDPTEVAFDFCKENNLDFNSLKFLTTEISLLLTKYKSNQLDVSQHRANDSIKEVEEEMDQSNKTKSAEDKKGGLIYNSIDSGNKKEGDAVKGYEGSKEHFTNTSMNGVMLVKREMKRKREELKAEEIDWQEEMSHDSDDNCKNKRSDEADDEEKDSLNYFKEEEEEGKASDDTIEKQANKENNPNHLTQNLIDSNEKGELQEMPPSTMSKYNVVSKEIKGINLIEVKAKPETNFTQRKEEFKPISINEPKTEHNKAKPINLPVKVSNQMHMNDNKQHLILKEADYNYQSEEVHMKDSMRENQSQTESHRVLKPISSNHQLIKEAYIEIISDHSRYCPLTQQNVTNHYYTPVKPYLNNCPTASNLNYSHFKPHLMNNHNEGSFVKLEQEKKVHSRSTSNVFQKLYEEGEMKRKMFKRPCHFSSRHQNLILNTNNTSKSNVSQAIPINQLLNSTSVTNCTGNKKKHLQPHNSSPQIPSSHKDKSFKQELSNTEPINLHPSTTKTKSRKGTPTRFLTKDSLFNPYLNKKLHKIQSEIQEKHPFKPHINSNYHFEPGLSFLERQDFYEKVHQSNKRDIASITPIFTSPSNHQCRNKEYNVFKKNYDFACKYKASRITLFDRYQGCLNEPFKCTSESNEIFNRKKEEAFCCLFKELDSDEDGVITSINISTKTIAPHIIVLINPLLEQIRDKGYICDIMSFLLSMEQIYRKLPLKDKRLLIEHYTSKKCRRHKEDKTMSSSRRKSFIDNKTQRMAEKHDRRVSLSFSKSNIIITNPTFIQQRTYFKSSIPSKPQNRGNSNIQDYTFQTYKSHLSFNY